MKNNKLEKRDVISLIVVAITVPAVFLFIDFVEVPPEIIIVPGAAILMYFDVKKLPATVSKEYKKAKVIAFLGLLLLAVAVLINHYLVNFFEFNIYMVVFAILPAFFYSLIFERKNKT